MSERAPDSTSAAQLRVHGLADRASLVYCPGLHGDWTLIARFGEVMRERVRFVDMAYPRTDTWSLDDYARAIEEALLARGISEAWLLGESFGSQVVWALVKRELEGIRVRREPRLHVPGVILAGGFVRYPIPLVVPWARAFHASMPLGTLRFILRSYERYARLRHRRTPASVESLNEFVTRRLQPGDRSAILHRYELIQGNDPRPIARAFTSPVYSVVALIDPIVLAVPVHRWLKRHCPGYRGWKVIPNADHNVLGTAAEKSADQIVKWMLG